MCKLRSLKDSYPKSCKKSDHKIYHTQVCFVSVSLGFKFQFTALQCKEKVRNLGLLFDPTHYFESHLKERTKTVFDHFRNIAKIKMCFHLKMQMFSSLHLCLHTLITATLLSGLPKKGFRRLQMVQNASARVVTKTRKCEHITRSCHLHWLSCQVRP